MSTGVVYASPGVVKMPPCVLNRVRTAYVARQVHLEVEEDMDGIVRRLVNAQDSLDTRRVPQDDF